MFLQKQQLLLIKENIAWGGCYAIQIPLPEMIEWLRLWREGDSFNDCIRLKQSVW
jgi:hypothetical protein